MTGLSRQEKSELFLDSRCMERPKNVIDMARATGGRAHICHVSHPMAAQVVMKLSNEGHQ